jgi:hypothetical protein
MQTAESATAWTATVTGEAWGKIAALASTALMGAAMQYFGMTAPSQTTSAANRDANWAARDALTQCNEERDRLFDIVLGDSGQ